MTLKSIRILGRKVNKPKPILVVISAPSGAGKSAIVEKLLERNDDFCKSISATTRRPRGSEKHGRDYFFMSREEFRNKIIKGEFIETAKVFDCDGALIAKVPPIAGWSTSQVRIKAIIMPCLRLDTIWLTS